MIYTICGILTILIVSQVYLFYLINKGKAEGKVDMKPGEIKLRNIPKDIQYEDVEPDFKTTYDVLETIRIEEWKLTYINVLYDQYTLSFISNCSNIEVMCCIREQGRLDGGPGVRFSYLRIKDKAEDKQISLSYTSPEFIKNDVIIFMWDYIIDYYDKRNNERIEYNKGVIRTVSSKLKTLRRSEKLEKILKNKIQNE